MTYPFVAAAFDYGARKGPALAFLVHMAEGGGTVAFLARDPARGVSVHYVIEYSGRIVQMLREDRASGSLNPAIVRADDDSDGLYGATAARAVMGLTWWHDPNSAVISVELEGFAADGPNADQARSLVELVDDVRGRHPAIGLLGHRDFQNEKACPGHRIAWDQLGGHGPANGGDMGLHLTLPGAPVVGELAIAVGVRALRVADGVAYRVPMQVTRPAIACSLTAGLSGPGYLVDLGGDELHFIRASEPVAWTPPPPAVVDCTDVVNHELEAAAARAATAVRTR